MLTLAQARRSAIAAQGLARARPAGSVTMGHLQRLVDRIGLLQIDSVNVIARAHLLPIYSRLGPYDTALLQRASSVSPRRLVEYWAHEASFVPPETYQLLRWRMTANAASHWAVSFSASHSDVLDAVRDLVADSGPLTAREAHDRLDHSTPVQREEWGWNWTIAKRALEHLFFVGELTSAGRTTQFERRYDLTERVLPPAVLAEPVPDTATAQRELVRIAASALGVASLRCLRDYFRMPAEATQRAVTELVDAGELHAVTVRDWGPAYVHEAAAHPRRVRARALLAPFDPLVFERARLEALFGMHYRIEIYTPAHKRVHGYYVLPFLLGDAMAARVDLKADRASGRLLVRAAFAEDGAPADTAEELAAELGELATWLGLSDVVIDDAARGDLLAGLAPLLPRT
ncbi:protein of unknown function DUF1006 [Beutenbergia cavernae DSM 12333]|uniref:Cytoplasmic protein n=1 Tax=Beutenbergia cavernae (strain ATCC BAA-8 / DSM 12333 / CCUG 43141 / JCM 11478 / NBRC 16432 / NCIMB 13614 / HKI 0122) TaxID=471853 RepID=C5C1N7_BEUC1|nr:protein of unknown function DUF1006 [Beutenbergia cavernae DSM 12333]